MRTPENDPRLTASDDARVEHLDTQPPFVEQSMKKRGKNVNGKDKTHLPQGESHIKLEENRW